MLSNILGMLSILRTTLATALMPGVKSRLAKIIFLLLTRKSKLITNFLKIFEFSIFAREKIPTEVKNRVLSLMVDIVTKRDRSLVGFNVQYVLNNVQYVSNETAIDEEIQNFLTLIGDESDNDVIEIKGVNRTNFVRPSFLIFS